MDQSAEHAAQTLPQWKSHKIVRAGQVTAIRRENDGYSTLVLEGGKYEVRVSDDWRMRDLVAVGGYYVAYADGYSSYSPAKAFEDGHTRVE